jgi:hypothetical protein
MQRMAADLIRKMLDDAGDHPTASAMRRVAFDWADAILAIPMPTPADRLAEARKLPEVKAAMLEALDALDDAEELYQVGILMAGMDLIRRVNEKRQSARAALRPFTGEGK